MPRFIRHISDSALQFLVNQVFGLGLFYVLSEGLDKVRFGELNWTLAVFMTAFDILGAGLDQLTVRKIAAGDSPVRVLSLYRTHVWVSGVLFYAALLAGRLVFPGFFLRHSLLLWMGIAKTGMFFSTPFKQLAAGREQFRILFRMSVGSSVIKGSVLLACFFLHVLTIPFLLAVFIAGDLFELCVCSYLGRGMLEEKISNVPVPRRADRKAWLALLRESMPQVGVVLFSAAMARFDWIFIGLYTDAARLAEYSFAYKAFEMSSLPLLVIAPLLVPAFTRLSGQETSGGRAAGVYMGGRMDDLRFLLRGELVLGCGVAMLLNIVWTPLVDGITSGRYGAVNARTIFFLSLCLPVMYLNNFLWTIHFARGRLKMIFRAFAVSFALNVAGDVVLIPLYGNEGAALAYLLAIGLQTFLFQWQNREVALHSSWVTLFIAGAGAALGGYAACRMVTGVFTQLLCASVLYFGILFGTAQLRPADYRFLKGKFS
jgi:O-antigen/teichoic acid export membrane protein